MFACSLKPGIKTLILLATSGVLCHHIGHCQDSTMTDSARFENLGERVNSKYNEIGPVISPDGRTLYFSRIGHPQNTKGETGSQDIWFSELKNDQWTQAKRLPIPLNQEDYNSLYSITPDGNTILIKGSYANGKYQTRGFSLSRRMARGWSKPEKLEIPGYEKLSKGEFDCGFLTNDGNTLLMAFSSKKKSKSDDIYVSFKDKEGKWSKPLNLGSNLNTKEFTETTPFLAPDGATMYFSSDRGGSLGSNDIYYSRRLDKSWTRWSRPINMGPSVNTKEYDAYYTVSALGDYAYFSSFSDKTLGKGDVVRMRISYKKPPGMKEDSGDIIQPDPVVIVSGKVIDSKTKKPIDSRIIFEDLQDGTEVGMATTDPITGIYKHVLPYGRNYLLRPYAPRYLAQSENIDLTDSSELGKKKDYLELKDKNLQLVPFEKGQTIRLNNIFFQYGSAKLLPESFLELDRMVQILNENSKMKVEVAGHTDSISSDRTNNPLSQNRANAVREYFIQKGIDQKRLTAKGYGKYQPVASNTTLEGRKQNRRVEVRILENAD